MGPWFCFFTALLLVETQSCPEICNCVAKKKYGRHIADCSYRDLRAVPLGLPFNATTLTLSVNHISSLQEDSFADVVDLQALWLSHNEISAVAQGTFASLVQLRAIDLSHNRIAVFPWGDLLNLTALQQLKLSSNRLEKVPPEAFRTLRDLRSLWLNDNRLSVLAEGTFSSLPLLSQLQINHNPFNCSCKVWGLKRWLEETLVSIPERDSITCAAPDNLKGFILGRALKLDCMLPSIQLAYHSSLGNSVLHDELTLRLHCSAVGRPPPEIQWKIQTSTREVVINGPNVGEGGNWLAAGSLEQRILVFKNGSMAIPEFTKADEGIYTCQALNDVGSREASVNVALAGSKNPAGDTIRNNIQASKPQTEPCEKEESPKSEDKFVVIYLTPVVPMTSNEGATLWEPEAWAGVLLLSLLTLYG
ncbi:immunoglobulin superfamily containing leucine-rich repeat protein [Podarcis muralis]